MCSAKAANPAPGFEQHPNYEVRLEPVAGVVEVKVGETTIARSERAVTLLETRHHPVWYMPLEDIHTQMITPTQTSTYCPFKGHASYWSVNVDNQTIEDAIWAYMAPYDECLDVAGYASFYTNKVDLYVNGEQADKSGPGRT